MLSTLSLVKVWYMDKGKLTQIYVEDVSLSNNHFLLERFTIKTITKAHKNYTPFPGRHLLLQLILITDPISTAAFSCCSVCAAWQCVTFKLTHPLFSTLPLSLPSRWMGFSFPLLFLLTQTIICTTLTNEDKSREAIFNETLCMMTPSVPPRTNVRRDFSLHR